MRHRIRPHLTFANVVSVIALFIALGGTAMASVIITSNSQVAQNTISGHKPPSGDHPNIIAGSINGQDIADRSGVDTCKTPLTIKLGAICAGSDAVARPFLFAAGHCSDFGLRLPTLSEAITLARNYDVPGVSGAQGFWADEEFVTTQGDLHAELVNENGLVSDDLENNNHQTVCVTDPSA
jgi:hypothetical protein